MTGLTTGKAYSFYVQAINYNGLSLLSDEVSSLACLAPTNMPTPYLISSTTSSITVGWEPPMSDGGCPIYTYALYVNDGLGNPPTLTDDSQISGKPYLSSHTVIGLTQLGNPYQF